MSPHLALLSLIRFYYLGSGWSVPVELIVGTETGISYSTEKSHSPTLLADFNQVLTFRLTMIITVISYVCTLLHWCMLRCMSICGIYYRLLCVLCHGKNNEAFRWYISCIANFSMFLNIINISKLFIFLSNPSAISETLTLYIRPTSPTDYFPIHERLLHPCNYRLNLLAPVVLTLKVY